MTIFSGRTQPEPSNPPSPAEDELTREQVLAIFRAAGDVELRRHIPILQTDGRGFIGFLCGCGRTMNHDYWWTHINAVLKRSTSTIPKR